VGGRIVQHGAIVDAAGGPLATGVPRKCRIDSFRDES
jgi:hypothetical protein